MASGDEARRRWRKGRAKTTTVPRPFLPDLSEPVSPVHLETHVVGDLLVKLLLRCGQFVANRIGVALREERRPVEAHEFLLQQATHEVAGVAITGRLAPSAVLTLEAIGVDERHEELELLLLSVVRRSGQEKEIAA